MKRQLGSLGASLAIWLLTAIGAAAHMEVPGAPGAPGGVGGAELEALPLSGTGAPLPLQADRQVNFTTDEGTWMSLDIAPDGKSIVFDLLGDIYVMASSGGEARALLAGMAFESQPVFSPDGASLVFLSDRTGNENVWLARADGTGARQITFLDDNSEFTSPEWSADGREIYVSTLRPEIGAFELWAIDLKQMTSRRVTRARGAPFTPHDSRLNVVGARPVRGGDHLTAERYGTFSHHEKIPTWRIMRRDPISGRTETVIEAQGSAMRPTPSADGRFIAYATRVMGRGQLRLRDLSTGADRLLADDTQVDQQEAWPTQDLVPRFDFTPDGKSLIFLAGGRFARADIETGAITPLAFSASVSLDIAAPTRREIGEETGPVRARLVQDPAPSPDGRLIAFSALRRLRLLDTRDGSVSDLGAEGEFHPAWSADGKYVVSAGWDPSGGAVLLHDLADGGRSALTSSGAFYTHPVFTPDGAAVIAVRSSHYDRLHKPMEYGPFRQADLVRIDLTSRAETKLASGVFGGGAQFVKRSPRIYIYGPGGLLSFAGDGSGERAELAVMGPSYYFLEGRTPADDVRISPDGAFAIAKAVSQLYVIRLTGTAPRLVDVGHAKDPVRRLTKVGADYIAWAHDGTAIYSALGSSIDKIAFSPALLKSQSAPRERIEAVVEVPRDEPEGTLLLRGATAITMRGDEIIKNADILIVRNRIKAIGRRGSLDVPRGTPTRSLKGQWVLPGFIDTHAHWADIRRDVLEPQPFGYLANLAYGVTSGLDPSTLTIDQLAYQDLIEAGFTKGPRTFSTGPAVFSYAEIDSLETARDILRRYKEHYRVENLKQYRVGNRRQRQLVAIAAREIGLMPTTEGAANFKLDMTQAIDGFAGNEHTLPAMPLSRDVVRLLADAGMGYTLTLLNTNGGAPGTSRFFTRHDYPRDEKLRRFTPLHILRLKMDRVPYYAEHEFLLGTAASGAAALQRSGGIVGVGSHSELEGLGFHWEMQALALGGLTPHEVLRAATIGSARTIGRAGSLGSLEAGKLADLLILERDPTKDLANSLSLTHVMKNGRLYDASTLDEVWPRAASQPPLWFHAESD